MPNILVPNIGFGIASPGSLETLKELGSVTLNEKNVRFSEDDLIALIPNADILLVGTEKITARILGHAKNLKLIARLGVGVDNIDLEAVKQKGISITYTPEAPSKSVPEFALALMLDLLKGISLSNLKMHAQTWHRPMGRMLSSVTVGIIGAGKIGKGLIELIQKISPSTPICFFDPFVDHMDGVEKCDLDKLLLKSDVISLHLPLTKDTQKLINKDLLIKMKKDSYLMNTSRGAILDEDALYEVLASGHLAGAALDVFENEPYTGKLTHLENCITTAHIGSLTQEIRALMEEQVTEDIQRYVKGQDLLRSLNGFNTKE